MLTSLNKSTRAIFGANLVRALSLILIFILLLSVMSAAFNGARIPIQEAAAQQPSKNVMQVSFTYDYSRQGTQCEVQGASTNAGCGPTFESQTFSGKAYLKPAEGGFEGNGTGNYDYVNYWKGTNTCGEFESRTHISGPANMTVNAQYSIDNPVTGGPDTSKYNSSTTVVEILVEQYDLHSEFIDRHRYDNCQQDESYSSEDGQAGFGCYFYDVDFTSGGDYKSYANVTEDSYGTCSMQISPMAEELRIYGNTKGLVEGNGSRPISNSKVVIAKMEEGYLEKLSKSKPDFMKATATSDDKKAEYEFRYPKEAGNLPRILVVSLLWYEGKPEFAVTNGDELDGRFIPVYQAACVDDIVDSKCEKWKRTTTGYEAEVNFEYGSAKSLSKTLTTMGMEDWKGGNATLQIMSDSAYMYYNAYIASKYFESLSISTSFEPLMIKSHNLDSSSCPDLGAYYVSEAKKTGTYPSFGDLGTNLRRVQATGSGIYFCDMDSSTHVPDNPVNGVWHEMGHYLHYDMYWAKDSFAEPGHSGYEINKSTNGSFREGFGEFIGMLVAESQGSPNPYIYPTDASVTNLEADIKIWDDEEFAIAGILWDLHDGGIETNHGFVLNGTRVNPSRVLPAFDDKVALGAKTIIDTINANEPLTLVDIYDSFNGLVPKSDLDMIFVNHGAFADIVQRNYIHDSWNETISQTGETPSRLFRAKVLPNLPGSYIVSDKDAVYNVTFRHIEPFGYYDFSYTLDMKADTPFYFKMPPEYYPSTAIFTPLSVQGEKLPPGFEIDSDEYWEYIHSGPPKDGVFKRISVEGSAEGSDSNTNLQYIQNVKDLLSKASAEYKGGNATGAEELARVAYLDNFEYVEPALVQRNATDLKEEIEEMLRVELVQLIRDNAGSDSVDAKIAAIDAKLDEAIVIVPEFPPGVAVAMLGLIISIAILSARYRGKNGLCSH